MDKNKLWIHTGKVNVVNEDSYSGTQLTKDGRSKSEIKFLK